MIELTDPLDFWREAAELLPEPAEATAADLDRLAAIGAGLQALAVDLVGALASVNARSPHVGRAALAGEVTWLEALGIRGERAASEWRMYVADACRALGVQPPASMVGRRESE